MARRPKKHKRPNPFNEATPEMRAEWGKKSAATRAKNKAARQQEQKLKVSQQKYSVDQRTAFFMWVKDGMPSMRVLRVSIFDEHGGPVPSESTLSTWRKANDWETEAVVAMDKVAVAVREEIKKIEAKGSMDLSSVINTITEGLAYRALELLRLPPSLGGLKVGTISGLQQVTKIMRDLSVIKDQVEGNPTTRHEIKILEGVPNEELVAMLSAKQHWGNGAGPRPLNPPEDWDPDNENDVLDEPTAGGKQHS